MTVEVKKVFNFYQTRKVELFVRKKNSEFQKSYFSLYFYHHIEPPQKLLNLA